MLESSFDANAVIGPLKTYMPQPNYLPIYAQAIAVTFL